MCHILSQTSVILLMFSSASSSSLCSMTYSRMIMKPLQALCTFYRHTCCLSQRSFSRWPYSRMIACSGIPVAPLQKCLHTSLTCICSCLREVINYTLHSYWKLGGARRYCSAATWSPCEVLVHVHFQELEI
jgi:hypothetical protein